MKHAKIDQSGNKSNVYFADLIHADGRIQYFVRYINNKADRWAINVLINKLEDSGVTIINERNRNLLEVK
tara:strand:+ start:6915 stop:7124 length:210 start_codon:yes stop_codon:yes gene_type:complete